MASSKSGRSSRYMAWAGSVPSMGKSRASIPKAQAFSKEADSAGYGQGLGVGLGVGSAGARPGQEMPWAKYRPMQHRIMAPVKSI